MVNISPKEYEFVSLSMYKERMVCGLREALLNVRDTIVKKKVMTFGYHYQFIKSSENNEVSRIEVCQLSMNTRNVISTLNYLLSNYIIIYLHSTVINTY